MKNLIDLQRYLGIVSADDERSSDLKELTSEHKMAIVLHLEGFSRTDIADQLGRSVSWVRNTLTSRLAQNVINDYLAFSDQEFKALYQLSIEAIRDALRSEDISVRLKAADKYLKAHGKYNEGFTPGETAEDVVKRVMEMDIVRGADRVQIKMSEERGPSRNIPDTPEASNPSAKSTEGEEACPME